VIIVLVHDGDVVRKSPPGACGGKPPNPAPDDDDAGLAGGLGCVIDASEDCRSFSYALHIHSSYALHIVSAGMKRRRPWGAYS